MNKLSFSELRDKFEEENRGLYLARNEFLAYDEPEVESAWQGYIKNARANGLLSSGIKIRDVYGHDSVINKNNITSIEEKWHTKQDGRNYLDNIRVVSFFGGKSIETKETIDELYLKF